MNLGTNLFIIYLIYFILTYIKLVINKKFRNEHKKKQKQLDALRKIPIKTDKQQKQFLDLKYPKEEPFKWSFKNVGLFLLKIIFMVILFIITKLLWKNYIKLELPLWFVIIFVALFPILINKILKKYNLHQDDLSIFFRGKKK